MYVRGPRDFRPGTVFVHKNSHRRRRTDKLDVTVPFIVVPRESQPTAHRVLPLTSEIGRYRDASGAPSETDQDRLPRDTTAGQTWWRLREECKVGLLRNGRRSKRSCRKGNGGHRCRPTAYRSSKTHSGYKTGFGRKPTVRLTVYATFAIRKSCTSTFLLDNKRRGAKAKYCPPTRTAWSRG